MPLFQGGSVVGGLQLSHTNRDIALAQYEKAIQTAFREVADALALTGTLERQREAQEALVGADERAYELSQQRYKAGRDSYLAVLDSQRDYYSAQQGLIATAAGATEQPRDPVQGARRRLAGDTADERQPIAGDRARRGAGGRDRRGAHQRARGAPAEQYSRCGRALLHPDPAFMPPAWRTSPRPPA